MDFFTSGIGDYFVNYTGSLSELLQEGWGFSASIWEFLENGFTLDSFFAPVIPTYVWVSLSVVVGFAYMKNVLSLLPF